MSWASELQQAPGVKKRRIERADQKSDTNATEPNSHTSITPSLYMSTPDLCPSPARRSLLTHAPVEKTICLHKIH
jgi:hypothetical protein